MTLSVNFNLRLCRDGTTDTTRTVHFGTPTAQEKVNFTLNVSSTCKSVAIVYTYEKRNCLLHLGHIIYK